MLYEEELTMDPAVLDKLNRLLEAPAVHRADGAILQRLVVKFKNAYSMQLWIRNDSPEPQLQAILLDRQGDRIVEGERQPAPVEGRYELEFMQDHFVMLVEEE